MAPRLPVCLWKRATRGVLLSVCLWQPAQAQYQITGADYANPVDRYHHDILGDTPEWGSLRITVERDAAKSKGLFSTHKTLTYSLDNDPVYIYEDTVPRLWDIDGDGVNEVVAVQSHQDQGARLLAIGLDADGKPTYKAATPHIGQRHRWLAPVGMADLDKDGFQEIVYIDRPHLKKRLIILNFRNGRFEQKAAIEGLSNHKIGWNYILGGIRTCTGRSEIITLDENWKNVVATEFTGSAIKSHRIANYQSNQHVERTLQCQK